MDPALMVEIAALSRLNTINAAIAQGDSPVQQFYRDTTIFVTGGSGFLGKQLIEKLFRSCEVKKIYLLLRQKKNKCLDDRLQSILNNPVFNRLRQIKPYFADRIVPVAGDVAELKLSLTDEWWNKLTQEVQIIVHGAAAVKFDIPMHVAALANVRGTRETITLARACPQIKSYIYLSTAFTHATTDREGQEVLEKFYPSPIDPSLLIDMAERMTETRLNSVSKSMLKGWPNAYTFTKALAEELIRNAEDLPACVIRPPIVIGSYSEPNPGWLDNNAMFGPSRVYLGVLLGILHVFRVNVGQSLPLTPVDYVNNCAIAAGWDCAQRRALRETDVPIYTISNSNSYISWGHISDTIRNHYECFSTSKALWYCFIIEIKNNVCYHFFLWIVHYIPAYVLDVLGTIFNTKPKGIKSFVELYKKIDKFATVFNFFLSNTWIFKDDNVQKMRERMSDNDKVIYNCDLSTIDRPEVSKIWGIGIRRFIINDGLQDSVVGLAKQKKLKVANYLLLILYLFVLIKCLMWSWYFVSYLMSNIIYRSN